MTFEVFREPLYRRYYAPASSAACCYMIACGFLLLFLPLFIAYNSSSFWLKEATVYEQPHVQYTYQTMFQFHGSSSSGPIHLFWSTSNGINSLYGKSLRAATIVSSEKDDNRDGTVDRLEIGVQLPLLPSESVSTVEALVFYDVRLQDKAKYKFDALSHISHTSGGLPMGHLDIDGVVMVKQYWPLRVKGGYKTLYDDNPLIPPTIDSTISADDVSFFTILRKDAARNLSLSYQTNYAYSEPPLYTTVANASGGVDNATSIGSYFNASLTLRIPKQDILYTPAASEVVKFAWIQYVSIFVIVGFLLYRLNSFIFKNQLLRTYTIQDVSVKKIN